MKIKIILFFFLFLYFSGISQIIENKNLLEKWNKVSIEKIEQETQNILSKNNLDYTDSLYLLELNYLKQIILFAKFKNNRQQIISFVNQIDSIKKSTIYILEQYPFYGSMPVYNFIVVCDESQECYCYYLKSADTLQLLKSDFTVTMNDIMEYYLKTECCYLPFSYRCLRDVIITKIQDDNIIVQIDVYSVELFFNRLVESINY